MSMKRSDREDQEELQGSKMQESPEEEKEEDDAIMGFERLAGAHHSGTLVRLTEYQASIHEPLVK